MCVKCVIYVECVKCVEYEECVMCVMYCGVCEV